MGCCASDWCNFRWYDHTYRIECKWEPNYKFRYTSLIHDHRLCDSNDSKSNQLGCCLHKQNYFGNESFESQRYNKSMAAWQEANGLEPSGILTTAQRDSLLAAYQTAQAALGLQLVTEEQAGIEITLPTALVEFDHYEPPFVHYRAKGGSGVKVILISQPGDQSTLYGLYDVLQTLEDVPLDGARSRSERSFTIDGRSAMVASHSYVELSKGLVKGYMLVWDPRAEDGMDRVLAAMQASFRSVGDKALDPGLVPMAEDSRRGLLSGLEVRRPEFSRSGFYVDAGGAVLTTREAVEGCNRVTLDLRVEADVVFSDAATGLALLKPRSQLSPPAVAELLGP